LFGLFFLHAERRGPRSTKTEKTKKKQAEAENNELKTKTELYPVVFAHLDLARLGPVGFPGTAQQP
jgi:hypothetical protein